MLHRIALLEISVEFRKMAIDIESSEPVGVQLQAMDAVPLDTDCSLLNSRLVTTITL
jgi:hypothetical protein